MVVVFAAAAAGMATVVVTAGFRVQTPGKFADF